MMHAFLVTSLVTAMSFSGVIGVRPGDSCTRDSRTGICTRIYECAEVIQGIQQNREPPRPCYISSKDAVPFVCCLDHADAANSEPVSPTPTRKPANPRPTQVRERLARRKCREYAKLVFEEMETIVLMVADPIKVDTCVKSAEELIVGGVQAILGEFPHMALLGYGDDPDTLTYDCGGSLISDLYVLTASHCIAETTPSHVLLGEHILRDDSDDAQTQLIPIASDGLIPHPKYHYPSHYYDIALIRLARKATLGSKVRPACLHTGDSFSQGSLIASGWGRTDFGGDPSDILLKVNLNVVEVDQCNKTYRNTGSKLIHGIRNDQQICAGSLEGGKDTCQGDSGGPLQVFRSDPHCTYDIVGVVSFGKGCALPNTPGVYARVEHAVDWIESIVWPSRSNEPSSRD